VTLTQDQSAVRAMLADPATHGLDPTAEVRQIETHASLVFLAGGRAVKLKKAVRYPYLDFSTLQQRLDAARAELAINRRFAPALYEGLGAVCPDGPGLALHLPKADGHVPEDLVEPVVVMRRFDIRDQLDHVAERGDLTPALADRLGIMAADIADKAEPVTLDWSAEFFEVVRESLGELDEHPSLFDGAMVATVRSFLLAWIDANEATLSQRAAAGWVRRCHGDLHLRNIVAIDGWPVPFDALEFDETLASTDTAYDLAFLVMDLMSRDLHAQAARSLCTALALLDDPAAAALMPVYCATRAIIRAKVLATLIQQDPKDGADQRVDQARAYLALAQRLAGALRPRLVAIGGLSGTGKTTAAMHLAPRLGPVALVIRSDVVRKRLLGLGLFDKAPEASYDRATSERVYQAVREQARTALAAGVPVVLDAVFAKAEERAAAEALAADGKLPFTGAWLDLPVHSREQRIAERGADVSDADAEITRRQEERVSGDIGWSRLAADLPLPALTDRLLALIAEQS